MKLTKLAPKEKNDDNVESARSKDDNSIDDNNTHNVVLEPDIEDEQIIDLYNTPKVPNDGDKPSIDFNDTPKLPIINNVVNCETQTSNIRACAVNCLSRTSSI